VALGVGHDRLLGAGPGLVDGRGDKGARARCTWHGLLDDDAESAKPVSSAPQAPSRGSMAYAITAISQS
jgi:hypothetical protein